MKTLFISILFFCCLVGTSASGQEETKPYFSQFLLNNISENQFTEVKEMLSSKQEVDVVRINFDERRIVIITHPLSNNLTNEMISNWIGNYALNLSCLEIGVWGVDNLSSYPFQNCQ